MALPFSPEDLARVVRTGVVRLSPLRVMQLVNGHADELYVQAQKAANRLQRTIIFATIDEEPIAFVKPQPMQIPSAWR